MVSVVVRERALAELPRVAHAGVLGPDDHEPHFSDMLSAHVAQHGERTVARGAAAPSAPAGALDRGAERKAARDEALDFGAALTAGAQRREGLAHGETCCPLGLMTLK